ncbi:IS91 family transposase [Defluviicoccus vanus]|uniref:IS91 family transposase n=1 Tax=Defluviicoccus vanus TaxID=111831 RepID=A0A7H1N1U2_9PROT|nr:IS91 family transposase [Defluviicoccus vanus]QNT69678.1 IS91 family transposase [Defluviicoccus vanus]QNT69835.1 IS91 family transposase [Defluviicoccus vanus]
MAARWEVADVFRRHGDAYRRAHDGHLGRVERRVMSAVALCRTAALGGHAEGCADCGFVRHAYNSCRNRHCPKCQGQARAEWLAARQAELLPVPYFHVVFTVASPAAEIAFQNKQTVYAILFRTAAETLRRIAADPNHLGAEIGLVAVLHTWGQTLQHHPHVHCVVPGGGPSPDGTRWVACRPGFFLPIRVLSRLFRRLFLDELRAAFDAGQLGLFGDLAHLADPAGFARRLRDLRRAEWIVYAKPPFGGPEQVLAYLARYTHRVAIANSRLMTVTEDDVTFRWKDYRHHGKSKVMALDADEFIRRFLLHTLPDGFHRIRHYGFLANGHRAAKLALCRELLAARPIIEPATPTEPKQATIAFDRCPCCGGAMITFAILLRPPPRPSFRQDTS